MKTKKKGLKIFLIILGVFAVIIAGFMVFLSIGLDLETAAIKDVNITNVPDGIYTGEFLGSRFGNTLEVTVSGGKLTDIEIIKDMAVVIPGASRQLFKEVIDKQSLQVDAVSGATVSTKAYLKALENALDK